MLYAIIISLTIKILIEIKLKIFNFKPHFKRYNNKTILNRHH